MNYYGYIYLILLPQGSIKEVPDLPNLRPFYYGQKKGKFLNHYFGSGATLREWFKSKKLTNSSIRVDPIKAAEIGVERFVLCFAKTEKELNRLEEFFVNPVLGTLGCINRKAGGRSGLQIKEIWTLDRRQQQSCLLKKYEKKIKQSQGYADVVEARRQRGIDFAEWARLDKINNPEKYKQLYESEELRKKYSDAQIAAWQDICLIEKHQLAWSEEKRKSASSRESQKWTPIKRDERSRKYKEYSHWTNGVEDVYQKESPGDGWVSARLGTKKACILLGVPFITETRELAKHYFIQKNRKKRRKHNK
jgi:hypothetical protein